MRMLKRKLHYFCSEFVRKKKTQWVTVNWGLHGSLCFVEIGLNAPRISRRRDQSKDLIAVERDIPLSCWDTPETSSSSSSKTQKLSFEQIDLLETSQKLRISLTVVEITVVLDKSGFTGRVSASHPPACTLDNGYLSQNRSWLPEDDKVLAGRSNKMMGGSETVSRDKDAVHAAAIHVPIGWLRRVERGQVTYVSPSGTTLSTLDEVKAYLLTDGTCKCGLECPLIIHKVFNFSVGVKVEQNSQPSCKAEQDMTKLCNHRRKVVAMAALCRSMQASQLPFTNFHYPDVTRGDSGDPKKEHLERKEDERGLFYSKHNPVPTRGHNNLHPNPSPSPKSSHHFIYPYNGSSPVPNTGTNCHHPLDAFRRHHHHPPLPAASTASTSSSFPPHSPAQRSPRTPTPQNTNQGQITPKTPETPSSPWLGPLSSPPPSSPMTLGGVRGGQTHYPLTPLSPSNSFSPSVHPMGLTSHQRSRHPSASPSSASEHGGGSTPAEGGGGLMGNNLPHRRKSASSSPHSPVPGGSPLPSPHFPKYKLDDILEQFKYSGNSSTNNHHILNPANPSLATNQSSSHPHTVSSKPTKGTATPADSAGPKGFGLSQSAPSNLPLGPLLNHHYSHQGKLPHPVSFPASTLLSAAAKAQLANQITQGSNASSSAGNLHSSLDVLKEAQQQQKVTNSTLHNSISSSSIASARLPHPSLATASAVLFPPSQTLAQSLVSSSPRPPPTAERGASHRKRRRRSPTVISALRDTPPLANGVRKATPDEAASATVINLSSSSTSFPSSSSSSSSHSYSTSVVQNQSTVTLENHHPRLSAPPGHLSRSPRPNETRSFTTAPTPIPLSIDPPTQPLSALLHLLSVQNAQASVSHSASAPSRPAGGGGHTNEPTLRQSPPSPSANARTQQSRPVCQTDNTNPLPLVRQPFSSPSPSFSVTLQPHSPPQSTVSTPLQRGSPCKSNEVFQSNSDPSQRTTSSLADTDQPSDNHIPTSDSLSQASPYAASPRRAVTVETRSSSPPTSLNLSRAEGNASAGVPSSPKPLDLSNHVLALFSAPSTATQTEGDSSNHEAQADASFTENPAAVQVEPEHLDPKTPLASTSPTFSVSAHHEGSHSPASSSSVGETAAPLALAEAFPFMNQEQLLQLLSSTGGLPSLLDSTILASLPLGGLWLGGQHAQLPPASVTPQPPPNLAEPHQPEQPHLLVQETQQQNQEQQQKQQQQQHVNNNPLFPLLPLLSSGHGELPLNLLGLLNPLAASALSAGQEPDLTERSSLQALLMASVLVGQQPASLLPLSVLGHLNQISLEVPIQHSQQIPATLEGLSLDKTSGLLDPTSGLLDITHGLLPLTAGTENPIQALQSLLLPAALPPPPAAFLPLSPALLTAALSSAELHSPPNTQLAPAQQTQHAQPQVPTDAAVDTLIPVSLQGKDNSLLQQLLPTLLNPSMLGDVPSIAGLQNMVGLGAGSILLSPVQASALGLLQSPDGGINLLNNIQLNLASPSDGEKPGSLQETQRPAVHEGLPASEIAPEVSPCPVSALAPPPAQESPPPAQRVSEGRSVIDPYTSFMDTIYTSFLQVSAKEQEDGAQLGPSDPTSPFCALPPVSFPLEHQSSSSNTPTLPQASAPVSLSPRRACALRNSDLSRLSLEAAAHSPAQGTPKPTEDGPTSPLQRKPVIEGHTHLEPPLHPVYLEEAKTDCTGPAAAVCPFVEMGVDRQGQCPHAGYLSPRDGRSERPSEETTETLLLTGQGMDQAGAAGGARRGRKRKQTLQNVLEDFRDMDATALEETKATAALLKPDRSVRGRRRRGTRSQRQ